jgi:glycerol uptake facilitator-like aquaporin
LFRLDWRAALRAFAGFLAGLAIWMLLSPLYNRVLASAAGATMRLFEKPPVTHLVPAEDNYVTVDRSDFDPRSRRPAIPIDDLTFNFILLMALFAAEARPFADRNIGGLLIGCVILVVTHIAAVITEVMSIYVAKLGPWSLVHYSDVERNVWGVANHSYRVVLMYAFAFSIWWICRPTAIAAPPDNPAKKGGKKPRRR